MTVQDDIDELEVQLAQVDGALLQRPEHPDLLTLRTELQDLIALTRKHLPTDGAPDSGAHGSDRPPLSDGRSDAGRPGETTVAFRPSVGDVVRAKWITGDHQFYAAKIVSQTGDPAAPLYTVKFLDYADRCTVKAHQVKPLHEPRVVGKDKGQAKAKAKPAAAQSRVHEGGDTPSVAAQITAPQRSGFGKMSSSSARDTPTNAPAGGNASTATAGAAAKKKTGNVLDKSKASWQAFASTNARTKAATMSVSVPVGLREQPAPPPPPPVVEPVAKPAESRPAVAAGGLGKKRPVFDRSPSPRQSSSRRSRSRSPPRRHGREREWDRGKARDEDRRRGYERDYGRR